METLRDFFRGLVASVAGPALGALGWAYAASLAVAAAFTVVVFRFVQASVAGSAEAADLRHGQSADWVVDVLGTPGMRPGVVTLMTLATVLVPVYLVLVIFLSGGVVSRVRTALGLAPREPFLPASARHVWPMARVALVEIVTVGIVAVALGMGLAVGIYAELGNAVPWALLAVAVFVLALVTSVFDYVRIGLVDRDDGSALKALGGALKFAGRRAPSVALLAVLEAALALAVWWLAVWLHSLVPLETGAGVLLGILVGQAGVLARLWARVAAYAAEASLWSRAS
jgi:hypothetical protein